MMPKVEVYSTPFCGFCVTAKNLLRRRNIPFIEIDVSDRQLRDAMAQRSRGVRTVPQIFINEQHVGGCEDLIAFDEAGKLASLCAP